MGFNTDNVKVADMSVNVTDTLKSKIAEYIMENMTEEDMKQIFTYCISDLFITKSWDPDKMILLNEDNDPKNTGYYSNKVYLIDKVKAAVDDEFNQAVLKEASKYMESDEFKDKAEAVGKEVVEFALEGYKTRMVDRLTERLVNNVVNIEPVYNGLSLHAIVNEMIDNRLRGY